jgi:hypothetical protein
MRITFTIFSFKLIVNREGLVEYKQAFIIVISHIYFISGPYSFPHRETCESVRFLTRQILFILKQ